MALINCPECGKKVSDISKNCIHCGCPFVEDVFKQKAHQFDEEKITVEEDSKEPTN